MRFGVRMRTADEAAKAFGDLEPRIYDVLRMSSICQGLMEDLGSDITGYGQMKFTAKQAVVLLEKNVDNLIFAINQLNGFVLVLHAQYHADEVAA